MSTHPNAVLLLALTPDGLSRKTLRDILAESGNDDPSFIKIDDRDYHYKVMEDAYDQSYQIAAKEGDIVLFTFLTYGYGETETWEKTEALAARLKEWAIGVCERHNCSYQIFVTANYW